MTIGLNGHAISNAIKDKLKARIPADNPALRDFADAVATQVGFAIEANNEKLEEDIIHLISLKS